LFLPTRAAIQRLTHFRGNEACQRVQWLNWFSADRLRSRTACMSDPPLSAPLRYLMAVLTALAALLFLIAFPFPSAAVVYLFFLSMVLISTWQGGLGPGLITAVLGVLGAGWLLLSPLEIIPRGGTDEVSLGLFAAISMLASWMLSSAHAERQRA